MKSFLLRWLISRTLKFGLYSGIFFLAFLTRSVGQNANYNEFNVKTMLPTSPEAATLGRFGDIPIGYYTGTSDVSIPLYTIKESGLEIPVILKYHNGGIKVSDQASNVGLEWSLEPGGSIIQIVNGTEDKFDQIVSADSAGYAYLKGRMVTGAYTQTAEVGVDKWECGPGFGTCVHGGTGGDSYATLTRLLLGDGQPDIYQYNFPGFSGRFYINPEKDSIVLIDSKAKINFVKLNDSTWRATTLDGNKFYFGAKETSSTYVVSQHTGYTWKLTSIVFANGKQINFHYNAGHYEWLTYSQSYHDAYDMNLTPTGEYGVKQYPDVSQHNTKNLTSITASNVTVQFNLENREDLDIAENDSSKRISSIDIIDPLTNRMIKSFKFNYSYFPYSTIGGHYGQATDTLSSDYLDVLGKRLRLDSIQEIGYDPNGVSEALPPYKMYYDSSAVLPLKTSCATDFWGYYNGKNNVTFMPDLSYFYYSGDSLYHTVPMTLLNSYYFTEANRMPDTSKIFAGLLKRIVYPTGGYSDFGYESNSFSNFNYPDSAKAAAAMKVESIEDQNLGTPTSTGHIVPHDSTIMRFKNIINKGVPLQGLGFNDLKASSITLVKIVGSTPTILRTWQMANSDSVAFNANNGVFQWTEDISVPYNSSAYYVVSVSLPDVLGAQNTYDKTAFVSSSFTYYDTAGANINTSYGGGVRIASIKNYSSAATLASQKILHYSNTDSTSSGILMSPLKYIYPRILWFASSPPGNTNCVNDIYSVDTTWFMSAESAVPFSDGAAGNIVGYSRVEELTVTPGGSNTGKHVYYYNNHASKYKINNPDDPDLTNGLVSADIIQNSTGDTLQKTNYYYTDIYPSQVSYTGTKILSNFIGLDQCSPPSYLSPYPNYKYEIDFYPITSRWMVPQQKVVTLFSGTHTLSTTENYYYNAIGQRNKTETFDSRSQTRTELTVYPYDTTGSQAQMLKDSSLNNEIIQGRSLVNNLEAQRIDYSYAIQNSMVVKSEIQRSLRGNPSFVDVSFDHYAPLKSLDQFTQKGVSTTLVWSDDKSFIISQCTNAGVNDIAYTSFEKYDTGSWAIGSATRDTSTAAVTGTQSYNLTSGNISKAGLTSGGKYIVSYWSQNGAKTISGASGSSTFGRTINGWTFFIHTLTASSSTITISGSGLIDELRLYPQGAQMTSYTHLPVVGLSSIADPNDEVIYYEYDHFGRLKNIKDYQGNIVKNMQYNYVNSCGDSCFVLPMRTFSGTQTMSYPVGVFSIAGKLLGNATNQAGYITLWMSDTADSHTGTLSAGSDSMHFHFKINAGRIVPAAMTGCRYYQYDFTYNKIDIVDANGCHVDFGDSTSVKIGLSSGAPNYPDTGTVLYTNLTAYGNYDYWNGHKFLYNWYERKYPDTSLKVITIYHNDGAENPEIVPMNSVYYALQRIKNTRGCFPQNMVDYRPIGYTQPSALSVSNISNWNKITTIKTFIQTTNGAGILVPGYSQDFMQKNLGLNFIQNEDWGDTMKLSLLKSDWNTAFRSLQTLYISNVNWNHEDLSGLTQLSSFELDDWYPSSPPISSTQIDNIFIQIAAGAGQYVNGGMIVIASRGTDNRTSASDAAVALLESNGWWIDIEFYP